MRRLWTEDTFEFAGEFHTIDKAGINPRPPAPIPIWFGGSAPALLERCARLGDGFVPVGSPNEPLAGPDRDDPLGARLRPGCRWTGSPSRPRPSTPAATPERWRTHAERWVDIGATHLAIATHNAGPTDADGHVRRVAEYLDAVRT